MNHNVPKLTGRQAVGLIAPYARSRLAGQFRCVWPIVLYLAAFQIFVLGIPIINAAAIAFGLAAVIVGLAFFMEGLLLGVMPIGETIGLKLPQKRGLLFILAFSFVVGFGATFAEPAISALKAMGGNVKPWDAPLLFLFLNKRASELVAAVGAGVGLAVMLGMLRFLYKWPLKPFVYFFIVALLALTAAAYFDPNLNRLIGLAWDCGAVTTGPVTVPLVLALGIGVNRFVWGRDSESSGFGVVTLASLLPVLGVLLLGMARVNDAPRPMAEREFMSPAMRGTAEKMFASPDALTSYAFLKGSHEGVDAYFGDDAGARFEFIKRAGGDAETRRRIFGAKGPAFMKWVAEHGTLDEKKAVFASLEEGLSAMVRPGSEKGFLAELAPVENLAEAARAIVPLTLFLLFVLIVVLRDRLPRADEAVFGLCAAMLGLAIFNAGIDSGLGGLGGQVGKMLPASFTTVPLEEKRQVIRNFTPDVVQKAVSPDGRIVQFFHKHEKHGVHETPFHEENYNSELGTYIFTPNVGPVFGPERGFLGKLLVLLFGFLMGFGATLAEPALNVMGIKVEEITIGTFRKSFLVNAVAVGVGIGAAVGLARIMWDMPLAWLLVCPYAALLALTAFSSEEYVCIGWDSAGVTTGPITVPLVMAVGLGIGERVGAAEGFGILAMASVYPIMTVLLVGLYSAWRGKRVVAGDTATGESEVA